MDNRKIFANGYYILPTDKELHGSDREEDKKAVPNRFPFDTFAAYKTRILCFANAAIYALKDDAEYDKKISAIDALIFKKLNELERFQALNPSNPIFSSELYRFFHTELPNASGLSPKDLTLAETMYVWQNVNHPVRTTRYKTGSLDVTQRETLLETPLTDAQKYSFLAIHNDAKLAQPKWFRHLPAWAQRRLKEIVPIEFDGDWRASEKFHPAILRQIPGEANSTLHELIVEKDGNIISSTSARRQGAPTSFYMKDPAERQISANQNLRQMLDATMLGAKTAFANTWGETADNELPCPVLLGGLVTPSKEAGVIGKFLDFIGASGGENNTKLAREKEIAAQPYMDEKKFSDVKVFNLNVAINGQRKGDAIPDENFIRFARNFRNQIETKQRELKELNAVIFSQRQLQLEQLDAILNLLESLAKQETLKGRNKNLYLAASYDVAFRLMQGLSTGNCKSSKDRKGLEFIMADALLLSCAERVAAGHKPAFPAFNAPDESHGRKILRKHFGELYASGHQLLVPHDNSPGSPGIKDERILDKDIVRHLKKMAPSAHLNFSRKQIESRDLYSLSKLVAEFNKPGTFWQKHNKTVRKYALIGLTAITTVISIGLCATGVMSPVGLLGIAGSAALAESIYHGGNIIQSHRDNKQTFAAQIARLDVSLVEKTRSSSSVDLEIGGGSTAKLGFKPARHYRSTPDNLDKSPTLTTRLLSGKMNSENVEDIQMNVIPPSNARKFSV